MSPYNDRGDRVAADRYSDLAGTQQIGGSEMDYDDSGRITDITHRDAVDAVIADYNYDYGLANQLLKESHHGETIDYGYDLLGQLTSADRTVFPSEFYTYDANGNRVSSHLHGSNYATGPNNQLVSDGDFDYEYDDEGSLILKTEIASGNVTEYAYDHRNRLTSATERTSGGIIINEATYLYDVLDRRIAFTSNAHTVYFAYDGDNTWGDFDSAGQVTMRYLFGNRIDETIAKWKPGEETVWYLTDRLDSVHDLVDSAGDHLGSQLFDSFGGVLSGTIDRFAFTGREYDQSLQSYHYRARRFVPSVGRFISQDTVGFAALDTNLYRYAGNSPSNATDPTGTKPLITTAILLKGITSIAIGLAVGVNCQKAVNAGFGRAIGPRLNPDPACILLGVFSTIGSFLLFVRP